MGDIVNNFFVNGNKFIQSAVEADNAKDYTEAVRLYMLGLDHFFSYIKWEKNKKAADAVRDAMNNYITRSEVLKKHVEDAAVAAARQPAVKQPSSAARGGTATATSAVQGADHGKKSTESAVADAASSGFVAKKQNVTWDDIVGLPTAKSYIRQAVLMPLQLPHLFKDGGLLTPWKGVLLFGPPGTGKTYLAKAVATEAVSTFLSVSASDIFSKWVGESEQQIKELFRVARASRPSCIIFIDEIDSMCKSRSGSDSEVSRRVLTEMLAQMDGIEQEASVPERTAEGGADNVEPPLPPARVVVIGATNRPWELDSGILRRFEKRVYIPLPDATARKTMLQKMLHRAAKEGYTVQVEQKGNMEKLVSMTEDFSAADMSGLMKEALMRLVRKMEEATHFYEDPKGDLIPCSPGDPRALESDWNSITDKARIRLPPLTWTDLVAAIRDTKPSVDKAELPRYESFAEATGVNG